MIDIKMLVTLNQQGLDKFMLTSIFMPLRLVDCSLKYVHLQLPFLLETKCTDSTTPLFWYFQYLIEILNTKTNYESTHCFKRIGHIPQT